MSKETDAAKAAWYNFDNHRTITSLSGSMNYDPQAMLELIEAIMALPDADASDTALRWTAEPPTEPGYYWGLDALGRLSLINVSYWYEDDDTLYYRAYMWGGESGPLEEIDLPRLRPRQYAPYTLPAIPEPAAIAAEGGDDGAQS